MPKFTVACIRADLLLHTDMIVSFKCAAVLCILHVRGKWKRHKDVRLLCCNQSSPENFCIWKTRYFLEVGFVITCRRVTLSCVICHIFGRMRRSSCLSHYPITMVVLPIETTATAGRFALPPAIIWLWRRQQDLTLKAALTAIVILWKFTVETVSACSKPGDPNLTSKVLNEMHKTHKTHIIRTIVLCRKFVSNFSWTIRTM